MCTAAAAKRLEERLRAGVFPSVRRNQSQLEHGKLWQLELEFEFFLLLSCQSCKFPARLSQFSSKQCAIEHISSINGNSMMNVSFQSGQNWDTTNEFITAAVR
jgi:hypothetical protein